MRDSCAINKITTIAFFALIVASNVSRFDYGFELRLNNLLWHIHSSHGAMAHPTSMFDTHVMCSFINLSCVRCGVNIGVAVSMQHKLHLT